VTISINKISENEFSVTVSLETTSKHMVLIDDKTHLQLTNGRISKENLLKISFEFLLERESNSEILSSFELMVIQNYFPEYVDFVDKASR
jgi:hypothetical protein|tara:strand:- start:4771 stop:5040 length:270 start_codon:yes stop_codon:yes gene_type:complete